MMFSHLWARFNPFSKRRSSARSKFGIAEPLPPTAASGDPDEDKDFHQGPSPWHFLSEGPADPASLPLPPVPSSPAAFKVRQVDHFFSRWAKEWKYKKSSGDIPPQLAFEQEEYDQDPHDYNSGWPVGNPEWTKPEWNDCCFIVVREIPEHKSEPPYFKLVIKSEYLAKICREVMDVARFHYGSFRYSEMNPKQLIPFLPKFEAYRTELLTKSQSCPKTEKDEIIDLIKTVDVVLDYYKETYGGTLASIQKLLASGMITFDSLFALFLPGTIVVAQNGFANDLQAFRVTFSPLPFKDDSYCYEVAAEEVTCWGTSLSKTATRYPLYSPSFLGATIISSLSVCPIQYHPRHKEIRQMLIERGKKWVNLSIGVHHMHYAGPMQDSGTKVSYTINGRVMIDTGNSIRYSGGYSFGQKKKKPANQVLAEDEEQAYFEHPQVRTSRKSSPTFLDTEDLKDEDFLIASPILYGFHLSDKIWIIMSVTYVSDIKWDTEIFENLIIPGKRKQLLQALVEGHNSKAGFDDFIKGKGRGLVISLYGPPGVGKTYSAEATCEHVKRPLLLVGAGDLGATAVDLDEALRHAFELASAWSAVILIDEADVFLEKRGFNDLERNAMIAVFLRHLEYYPSILFLTTNRVKAFDAAFHSRIHVALRFDELTSESLKAVWTAFLKRAGVTVYSGEPTEGSTAGISEKQLEVLSKRKINGRKVKNAVKTALTLATYSGEALQYEHIAEILDMTEDYTDDSHADLVG